MSFGRYRWVMVALLFVGSAILLFSCKGDKNKTEESLDAIKTEESENLTIIMSENGRKSYLFKTPLLEGYTLGRDPYREFRKGISITTFQDDSMTTVNSVLVANYAIYYENRQLWEAKGDVVVTKHDGTRLYTQQLFWNSITKRIYSNVDTKLVTETDELIGEGFESDEEMTEPRFRRWKGRMEVDADELRNSQNEGDSLATEPAPSFDHLDEDVRPTKVRGASDEGENRTPPAKKVANDATEVAPTAVQKPADKRVESAPKMATPAVPAPQPTTERTAKPSVERSVKPMAVREAAPAKGVEPLEASPTRKVQRSDAEEAVTPTRK